MTPSPREKPSRDSPWLACHQLSPRASVILPADAEITLHHVNANLLIRFNQPHDLCSNSVPCQRVFIHRKFPLPCTHPRYHKIRDRHLKWWKHACPDTPIPIVQHLLIQQPLDLIDQQCAQLIIRIFQRVVEIDGDNATHNRVEWSSYYCHQWEVLLVGAHVYKDIWFSHWIFSSPIDQHGWPV
jgi:hypothetical protein